MNPLLDMLRSDGSIVVNKKLAHAIGLHEAILFSELISKYNYFENKGQLSNGYFFNTGDNLYEDTTLSAKQQRAAIKNLEDLGLISTQIRGVPATKFFKINQNVDKLVHLLATSKKNQQLGTFGTTSKAECAQLVRQKGHGNNTKNNPNKNNKDYITLTSDDHSFISFYLSVYASVHKENHPRVTEDNYNRIMTFINHLAEFTDYEDYTDKVIEYFETIKSKNRASMVYFMYRSFELFDTNIIQLEAY